MSTMSSPVRLSARLEGAPSRGLWLVKWLLLVPHLVVLFFLWLAFPVLTAVALVAIVFTGRYPRALFDFNLGVLRWTWRVWYYGYGALATDRYPPFSLGPEPDYPATLDIAYPERLSRGLVLVKWWLLVLPHLMVLAFFVGGGGFVLWRWGGDWLGFDGGLVTLLSLFAGVALLFTGRYPTGIFDLVVGMNRWVLRVAAYAALMTDEYPPFRLDAVGADPADPPLTPDVREVPSATTGRWSPGRVGGLLGAVLLLLLGLGGVATGGTGLWLDGERDGAGYVVTGAEPYAVDGQVLRFDVVDAVPGDGDWLAGRNLLGDVRVWVTGTDEVFAGIARTADVDAYLGSPAGTRHFGQRPAGYRMRGMPSASPEQLDIWDVSASGRDRLVLDWTPRPGAWTLVVLNTTGRSDLDATLSFGATVPALRPVAVGALATGGVLLVAGAVVLVLVTRRRG